MKVTANELRRIIKEELSRMLDKEAGQVEEGLFDPIKRAFGYKTNTKNKMWPETPEQAKQFWPPAGDTVTLMNFGSLNGMEAQVIGGSPDKTLILDLSKEVTPEGPDNIFRIESRDVGGEIQTQIDFTCPYFSWTASPKMGQDNIISEITEILKVLGSASSLVGNPAPFTSKIELQKSIKNLTKRLGGSGIGGLSQGQASKSTDREPPLFRMSLGEVIQKFPPSERTGGCNTTKTQIKFIYDNGAANNLANQMKESDKVMNAIYGPKVFKDPATQNELHQQMGTEDIVAIAYYDAHKGASNVCQALESILNDISGGLSSVVSRTKNAGGRRPDDASTKRAVKTAFGYEPD